MDVCKGIHSRDLMWLLCIWYTVVFRNKWWMQKSTTSEQIANLWCVFKRTFRLTLLNLINEIDSESLLWHPRCYIIYCLTVFSVSSWSTPIISWVLSHNNLPVPQMDQSPFYPRPLACAIYSSWKALSHSGWCFSLFGPQLSHHLFMGLPWPSALVSVFLLPDNFPDNLPLYLFLSLLFVSFPGEKVRWEL